MRAYVHVCECRVCVPLCVRGCVCLCSTLFGFAQHLAFICPHRDMPLLHPSPSPFPRHRQQTRMSKKLRLRFFCFFFSFCFCSVQREKSWFRNSFREFVKRIVLNAFSNNSIELGTRVLPAPLSRLSQVACSRSLFVFLFPCFYTSGEREQRR